MREMIKKNVHNRNKNIFFAHSRCDATPIKATSREERIPVLVYKRVFISLYVFRPRGFTKTVMVRETFLMF